MNKSALYERIRSVCQCSDGTVNLDEHAARIALDVVNARRTPRRTLAQQEDAA